MFARRCDEGFEVSIQDELDRKRAEFCRISKCCEFQNVVTFFGILDTLGGMLAECILEDDSGDSVLG